MLKEMFQKKEPKQEEVKKQVAVVNPNLVQQVEQPQEEVKQEQQQESTEEVKTVNLIVSSEALDNGTYRYMIISNKIYSIGEVEMN